MATTILLVEDEAILAMAEAQMLRRHGFIVTIASTGERALEMVEKTPDFSLILMDIDLGSGMDGTEAAQKIVKRFDIPIAFLSSHTEPDVVKKTEGITSYGYIVKNSGETVIIASIQMSLRLHKAHVQLKMQEQHVLEKNIELDRYFSSSLDMLCISDIDGRLTKLNPEWERVLGYTVSEMEGRSFMDFVHEDDTDSTLAAVSMLEKNIDVLSFENRYMAKDGSYHWIEWRSKAIGTTIYAAARDVTSRKKAEDELISSKEQLRITLNSIGDAVISTDTKGNITQMNPVAEALCDWNIEEARGQSLEKVFRIVNAETNKPLDNPVAKVLRTGAVQGLANHTKLISKTGQEYQIADSAAPIKTAAGDISGVVLVFRDISESYQKEQQLIESEKRYRDLFENSPVGIFQADSDGQTIHINPMMETMVGASSTKDGIKNIGKLYFKAYPRKKQREAFLAALKKDTRVSNFEYEVPGHNGEQRWLSMNARISKTLPGGTFLIDGFISDITALKQSELSLKEAEWKFRALFEKGPLGVAYHKMLYEADGTANDYMFIDANRSYIELTGVDPRGKTAKTVFPGIENDPFNWIQTFGKVARGGESIRFENYLVTNKRWYDCAAYQYKPDHFVAAFLEITEKKEVQRLLAETRNRFTLALEGTKAGLWDWDMASGEVSYSKRWKSMLGYEDDEIENTFLGWKTLWHPDDAHKIQNAIDDYLAEKTKNYEIIHRLRHKNGEWRWILTRGDALKNPEGRPYRWVGTNIDITESKKNEERLKVALEEKTQLMKELNHRIKNNLNIVSSCISLKEAEAGYDLTDLINQVNTISLVHEKLCHTDEISSIKANDYLQDLLASIFYSFPNMNIGLDLSIDDILLSTNRAIPLGLIINELATNAVKHGYHSKQDPRFSLKLIQEERAQEYVLTVSNSGEAFPSHISMDTPKTLGLRLVSSLVTQIQGDIVLKKTPFPVFTIRFPM